MTNGSNDFGVEFSSIRWAQRIIDGHKNVSSSYRRDDIIFEIIRKKGCDLVMVVLNEYTCGVGRILEVIEEFPDINLIYIGGNWNAYTRQAKEYCIESEIGLFNTSEMTGALWRADHWKYHQVDKKGNPTYNYRSI